MNENDGPAADLWDAAFPRSSAYDVNWLVDGAFGANPLWLAEWLCRDVVLKPGMKVLDLGCGRAKSSIFLAREFGVEVWATDLWIDAEENAARIDASGVGDLVTAVRAVANDLPFEHGIFDAVVGFDSFQYFATDCLFLPYILQFLKPEGRLGFASASLMREVEGVVPEHLARFWDPTIWSLRPADWWRDHWARTGMVDVEFAESMKDGWRWWLKWAGAIDCADWYLKTLEEDGGDYLGYIRVSARRRPDTQQLPHDLKTGIPVERVDPN